MKFTPTNLNKRRRKLHVNVYMGKWGLIRPNCCYLLKNTTITQFLSGVKFVGTQRTFSNVVKVDVNLK